MWFKNFFRKRKTRKREIHADEQYLDALEIIKESMEAYLELLAKAKQNGDVKEAERLEAKLNSNFEYYNRSWNGSLKITHTIVSNCTLGPNNQTLKLD
jgi:hypothetical protein